LVEKIKKTIEDNTMKLKLNYLSALILMLISNNIAFSQVGITFTLGNDSITNDGSFNYYEFDILATATGNSQFKLAQVYIDYNTAGFGSSVFTNGNVTVAKGELLADVFQGAFPNFGTGSYSITVNDNTPSKLSIANNFIDQQFGTYIDQGYELSNLLGTTAKVYARVKIKIQNPSEYSSISLDSTVSQFELQQYYFTTPGTDNQANYSPVNVGSGLNEPLPVELSSFTSKLLNDKVQLNWVTKTEVNNYGFNVERKIKDGEWNNIGFVEGHGNSNSTKEYSYTDKDLFAGRSNFQYRLKQVDTDGKFEYSDVVEVEIMPTKFELSQNYPNPFNPSTTIRFSLPKETLLKINIYNMLGELVETLAEGTYEAGYHKVNFKASSLSSGAYIYRIESSDFMQVKKMILLR
jgi:hypothetical protein